MHELPGRHDQQRRADGDQPQQHEEQLQLPSARAGIDRSRGCLLGDSPAFAAASSSLPAFGPARRAPAAAARSTSTRRSRSFSWVRSRMSSSAYSNSGDQNSASNGQTSMQMPQYMHSEKSMAKRSSTLRCRSRASGRGRDRLLVRVDVDAPVGALARAQHADGAVLLEQRDDAAAARRQLGLARRGTVR